MPLGDVFAGAHSRHHSENAPDRERAVTEQRVIPRIQQSWRSLTGARRRIARLANDMRVRADVVYGNLAKLSDRYGFPPGLTGHELKVFSQNGEDGVLAEIFARIGTESRWFVEFGIGAGLEGNSVLLADVHGWHGLLIEGADDLYAQLAYKYAGFQKVVTRHAMVTAENVDQLMDEAGVPESFDLLSIDVDANDYWIWRALSAHRPRVVVCEYNGFIDPTTPLTQPYAPDKAWDGSEYFGASLAALTALGRSKGYSLVHADLTGTNSFFVDDEHAGRFTDCFPVPARRAVPALTDFRHRPDKAGRSYEAADPTGA